MQILSFCLDFKRRTKGCNQFPPGFNDPCKSAGPPGMTEWIKIPRSNFPVFSPPVISNPVQSNLLVIHSNILQTNCLLIYYLVVCQDIFLGKTLSSNTLRLKWITVELS